MVSTPNVSHTSNLTIDDALQQNLDYKPNDESEGDDHDDGQE